LISFAGGIDAKEESVSKAIKDGCSVSICPGGIAEMFWGYPKEGCLPREEYAFLQSRKGFIRMAMKHGVPVVPVYCFGNTHAMHKARMPRALEALSR
jgi:2-acylglycerol O-acyltransferase 2